MYKPILVAKLHAQMMDYILNTYKPGILKPMKKRMDTEVPLLS